MAGLARTWAVNVERRERSFCSYVRHRNDGDRKVVALRMTHQHFDITAAEATLRANIAHATAEGKKLVDAGQAPASFIAAQREFDEARLQFVLAGLRLENAGADRNEVFSAAGQALGQMWGNILSASLGARERATINGWIQIALSQMIGKDAATKTVMSAIKPMESGRA
jgi:hypothetical protein